MSKDQPVPPEIEAILIDNMGAAGALGGSIGGAAGGVAGSVGGGAGGRRGATTAAKRMKTVIETRTGSFDGRDGTALERCRTAFPRLQALMAADERTRFVVPIGRTGVQRVVVDIVVGGTVEAPDTGVVIRTFAKEGLLSRKPARRIADEVVAALCTGE